jgi:endoglucanase
MHKGLSLTTLFAICASCMGQVREEPQTHFYVSPSSQAAKNLALSCRNGASLARIAAVPQGIWFGDWNLDPGVDAARVAKLARAQEAVPIVVAYNIVHRDCGGASKGGAPNAEAYKTWIRALALGIGNANALVVLEPDALSQLHVQGCLTVTQGDERVSLIRYAISMFAQHAQNAKVYLDAGHVNAIEVSVIAGDLKKAGVAKASGFALNVSNYEKTEDNTNYGQQISSLIDGKHFVIDTSRNGRGPSSDHQFCNPPDRALGTRTQSFSAGLVDAYLWVQNPGTSDGPCNGGPPAGIFSLENACTLSHNASLN